MPSDQCDAPCTHFAMCGVQCLMCKVQRSKWEGSNAGAQAGDSAHTLMCLQSKGGPGARYVFYYALLSPLKIYPPCSIRIHSVEDGNANVNSTLTADFKCSSIS